MGSTLFTRRTESTVALEVIAKGCSRRVFLNRSEELKSPSLSCLARALLGTREPGLVESPPFETKDQMKQAAPLSCVGKRQKSPVEAGCGLSPF